MLFFGLYEKLFAIASKSDNYCYRGNWNSDNLSISNQEKKKLAKPVFYSPKNNRHFLLC